MSSLSSSCHPKLKNIFSEILNYGIPLFQLKINNIRKQVVTAHIVKILMPKEIDLTNANKEQK